MKVLPPQGALVTQYEGRARELHFSVEVRPTGDNEHKSYDGLWDTGATNTVITQKVVDELGLKPTTKRQVFTPQGDHIADVFMVDLLFEKSKLLFPGMEVTLGKPFNCDVLIGMDVIAFGDFAVTNKNGRTMMSFRAPSIHATNYVEELEREKKKPFSPTKRRKKRK